ncbi:DUF1289 domain-containing protein [Alkalimarinus sediminis]|uniref:DUF1289 domain-containing protein n=1 Tax=Alkalimarinus sediminis TaxID=1632866 RepID=A0A9E8HNV1_9ALTE|nr:DUF1289 domain-containing protein [Alkalimarinus sediminis]UZW76692.1 DUF1289 domain-containing protein [Alkalimarinus sediminis]
MNKVESEVVSSPCVSVCALDENDLCVGCYRTGVEISQWGSMSPEEKRNVIDLVKEREKASYIG